MRDAGHMGGQMPKNNDPVWTQAVEMGLGIALGILGLRKKYEAEVVVQEAARKALMSKSGFRGEAKFTTWFCSIVVNQCRDVISNKNKNRQPPCVRLTQQMQDNLEDKTHNHGPDEEAKTNERDCKLHRAVSALPQLSKEVVVLRHFKNKKLTFREIGQILGIPPTTAVSRYNTATEVLKPYLKGTE